MPRLILAMILLSSATSAWARTLDLPVVDPRRDAVVTPAFTAERVEIRLQPAAAAAARATLSTRGAGPAPLRALGIVALDRLAASLGASLEVEFPGESPPAAG